MGAAPLFSPMLALRRDWATLALVTPAAKQFDFLLFFACIRVQCDLARREGQASNSSHADVLTVGSRAAIHVLTSSVVLATFAFCGKGHHTYSLTGKVLQSPLVNSSGPALGS